MNILFLIQSLEVGGAQRAVSYLANRFAARGWRVSIYLLSSSDSCAYTLDQRVYVEAMGLVANSSGVLSAAKNNVHRVLGIRKVIRDTGADAVIGMSSTANVLISIAAFGLGVTVIGSERSHPEFRKTRFIWRQLRATLYRRLDCLVCLTSDTADWLHSNTSIKNVEVIPNGLEFPMVSIEPFVEIPEKCQSSMVVLSVGRFVDTKQFDQLITVFSDVVRDKIECILVIAGDGPDRGWLESLVKEKGLTDRILMPGAIGNLGEWYSISSVFVFLSRLEGFPNSLLEAMGHGLACISYDCKAGPRDLIHDKENGELIPLNDIKAATAALRRVLLDDEYRSTLAKNAERVKLDFSMDRVEERWVDVIESTRNKRVRSSLGTIK